MTGKTLFIFRHGLAKKHAGGYGKDIVTAPLLLEGIPAIKRMGKYLSKFTPDIFLTSSYIRCRQTATIISAVTHNPFHIDKRLNEYHNISFEAFTKQLENFLTYLQTLPEKNIFICSHVAPIAAIKHLLQGKSFTEENLKGNYPLPGVLLIIKDGVCEEIDFNNK